MIKLPKKEFSKFFKIDKWDTLDKNLAGLYFFYNDNLDLMYVGKASYLRQRVRQHLLGNDCTKEIVHNFKYFRFINIDDVVDRDIYETYYINLLKPLLNLEKTFTYTTQKYDCKYNPYEKSRIEYLQPLCDLAVQNNLCLK